MLNAIREQVKCMGWKNTILYFIIQRLFRINSHIPWPVHWSSVVHHPENISKPRGRPYPGYQPSQYIQALNGIIIGKNVRMGPGIKLISANHDLLNFDEHLPSDPIRIDDNCWISANAVILPGVHLGDHTVVAAGAVVTKSFTGNCLIGGVPAKKIKDLPSYRGKEEKQESGQRVGPFEAKKASNHY